MESTSHKHKFVGKAAIKNASAEMECAKLKIASLPLWVCVLERRKMASTLKAIKKNSWHQLVYALLFSLCDAFKKPNPTA